MQPHLVALRALGRCCGNWKNSSIPRPKGLAKYRPRLRYLLIDEGEFAEQELNSLQNLVAGLFSLENARTAQDVQCILETVRQCYVPCGNAMYREDPDKLQRALVVWLKRVMLPARLPGIKIPEVNTLRRMSFGGGKPGGDIWARWRAKIAA